MKWLLLILCSLIAVDRSMAMGEPLFIVNGNEMSGEEFSQLPPNIIKSINTVDGEVAFERYGLKGSEGVVEVALHYDTPAVFAPNKTFKEYLIENIKWLDDDPTARVVIKYRLKADCTTELIEVMESTDPRLKKRVLKAFNAAPRWESPTMNMGKAVDISGAVKIQLPQGREIPGEYYIR